MKRKEKRGKRGECLKRRKESYKKLLLPGFEPATIDLLLARTIFSDLAKFTKIITRRLIVPFKTADDNINHENETNHFNH